MYGKYTPVILRVLLLCYVFKSFNVNYITKIKVGYCALGRV